MANGNCSKCEKPLDGAHKAYCKTCAAEYRRNHRAKDIEAARAYQLQWQRANRDRMKVYKRRHTLKVYGLSMDQYDELLENQDGGCAICEVKPDGTLFVDHDHTTGAVRGLLCSNCNFGLGLFADDPDRLIAGVEYLRRSGLSLIKEES